MIVGLDLQKVKDILSVMAEYEEVIAALYSACAERWEEDKELWGEMGKEEILHAERIRWISQALEENPRLFDLGRPFNQVAISTAIAGVKKHIEAVRKGAYTRDRAVAIARDIEQSILESRYLEMLKTTNIEYLEVMNSIAQDTARHRHTIQKKLEEIIRP
ncbi:MAG: hypothetical protein N2572_03405 [Syntrophales bacterium]|nr:hypothetical protein [Syntrophales bacterium]